MNSVAFSPDFELMVTGCDDQRVRVFNAVTSTFICKLRGHTGAVRCVAVAPNSQHIASASYDKTVRVWRTRDAECVQVLKGNSNAH